MSLVAGVFSILAGLVGAFMLFYGVVGIIWLARDGTSADRQDVFAVSMANVIGVICAVFAIRWMRSAIKGMARPIGR